MINVEEKNPLNKNRMTPLHIAARYGHTEICQFIMINVKEKNPLNENRMTPLHLAAGSGHLAVCQLIGTRFASSWSPNKCDESSFFSREKWTLRCL